MTYLVEHYHFGLRHTFETIEVRPCSSLRLARSHKSLADSDKAAWRPS